jgi:hypothetical protein
MNPITDAPPATTAPDTAGTATPFFPVLSGRMINIFSVSNNDKRLAGARLFLAHFYKIYHCFLTAINTLYIAPRCAG